MKENGRKLVSSFTAEMKIWPIHGMRAALRSNNKNNVVEGKDRLLVRIHSAGIPRAGTGGQVEPGGRSSGGDHGGPCRAVTAPSPAPPGGSRPAAAARPASPEPRPGGGDTRPWRGRGAAALNEGGEGAEPRQGCVGRAASRVGGGQHDPVCACVCVQGAARYLPTLPSASLALPLRWRPERGAHRWAAAVGEEAAAAAGPAGRCGARAAASSARTSMGGGSAARQARRRHGAPPPRSRDA